MKVRYKTIDEYISSFPADIQGSLNKMRQIIREAAPEAAESVSYGIPTFKLNGNLVHFAAYKSHIGFYPTPSGIDKFREELSRYKLSKGTIWFPQDKTIPYDLVKRIVIFRVKENMQKKH